MGCLSCFSSFRHPDDYSDSSLLGDQSPDSEDEAFEAFHSHSGRGMMNDALLQIYSNSPRGEPTARMDAESAEKTTGANGVEDSVNMSCDVKDRTTMLSERHVTLETNKEVTSERSGMQDPLSQVPVCTQQEDQPISISVAATITDEASETSLSTSVTTINTTHQSEAKERTNACAGNPLPATEHSDINSMKNKSTNTSFDVEDKRTAKQRSKRRNRSHDVGEEGGRPREKRRRTSPKGEDAESATKDSLMQKHGKGMYLFVVYTI